MRNAEIVGQVDRAVVQERVSHAADVKENERRSEVRRTFRRVQRLNREQERKAQGWEPGFHNRIHGLRKLVTP